MTDENTLSQTTRLSMERIFLNVEEVVGGDHLSSVLEGKPSAGGDDIIRGYVGLEPSGKAHIGWILLADCIRNMLDEKINITILLADWHAWVNDKFGRDLSKISIAADYMSEVFRVLLNFPPEGDAPGELRFLRASELMDSGDYWEKVLKCSKGMSLARARRTFSIMGRTEDSSDDDLSAFFYPPMQAADIFHLKVDIALGGMDQRKAHMYMRDVADRNGWTKATCIHTPMISGLKGRRGGRMEVFDHKMSKSDPANAIILHDSHQTLKKKMRKAYLDQQDRDSPVYQIVENILLPRNKAIKIEPKPEFGEPSDWNNIDELANAVSTGVVHPFDLKMGVADGLANMLAPLRAHFDQNKDLLDNMIQISG
tara:strand:- start:7500 stop:8606 length:1107 start_codon:yes stop_codon:yes gene_type:complete